MEGRWSAKPTELSQLEKDEAARRVKQTLAKMKGNRK